MEPSPELEQVLRALAAAGTVEVREDGRWFATLADGQWEVRAQKDRVLVHIWSDKGNLVRRVLRVAENTPERIELEVQRFGQSKPGRLEFLRADLERPERQVSREEFLGRFRELLAGHFPDEDLESLSIAQDLEHSLSSCYARGVLRSGLQSCAVVGVSSAESAETQENLLVAGLLWLDRVRGHARKQTVSGLRLFLPKGASRVTLHRLGALEPSTRIEVFEADCPSGSVERIPASDTGNLQTWLVPRRELESLLDRARADLAPLCALAPESIAAGVVPGTRDVALRFRGIEFARWEDGRVSFGLADHFEQLTPENRPALQALVHKLQVYRNSLASDLHHPLYRAQPERWLETLVQEDVTRVDARLDPRHLYTQVPALSAGDRGVLDLLGVTRDRRLAVIELKANEDPQGLLQAADYWLRVRWHQQQDDFHRYGYFPGVALQANPPLLYLVAPGLRFHPATDVLRKFLARDIAITRVGLAENWRSGLRVIFRQ